MPAAVIPKLKDASLFLERGHVQGEWVDSASRKAFSVENPAMGESIGTCPEFSESDTELAIEAAASAFESFRITTPRERSRLLRKWHELMMKHLEDLTYLIALENGKAVRDALAEVSYAAGFLEWFSEEAPRVYGDVISAPKNGNQILTMKEPVGVCALITPWNFPAAMITRKAGAAIAAGCTVVIKPPAETPFTVNAIVELGRRAGIPAGVLNVAPASANTIEVVRTLTASPLVRKVSFTGSTHVGKILMRQCAETTLKKVCLELGGNAPFIVFGDADLEAAVAGLVACKFRGSGQTCVSANRIYVQDEVYDAFAARLVAVIRDNLVVGNSLEMATVTQGPLINESAVGKAEEHVRDALAKGAKVLAGGARLLNLGANFFQPTILTEMTGDMKLANDETFGPVAGLFRFRDEKEVVGLANDTEMGLAAYVFSREIHRAWRVARALRVGMVGVNTGVISDVAAAFGGVKSSGFGREGSKYGIEEYLTIKSVTLAVGEGPL